MHFQVANEMTSVRVFGLDEKLVLRVLESRIPIVDVKQADIDGGTVVSASVTDEHSETEKFYQFKVYGFAEDHVALRVHAELLVRETTDAELDSSVIGTVGEQSANDAVERNVF